MKYPEGNIRKAHYHFSGTVDNLPILLSRKQIDSGIFSLQIKDLKLRLEKWKFVQIRMAGDIQKNSCM